MSLETPVNPAICEGCPANLVFEQQKADAAHSHMSACDRDVYIYDRDEQIDLLGVAAEQIGCADAQKDLPGPQELPRDQVAQIAFARLCEAFEKYMELKRAQRT